MGGRPAGFKTEATRSEYFRWYAEAIAHSAVPIDESDVETSFATTHVLTAGDPSKPPLIALHGLFMSSTMWLPLLPTLTAAHQVRLLDAANHIIVIVIVIDQPDVVDARLRQFLGTP